MDSSFYSSYGWHPLAVEAAIATIRYWMKKDWKYWRLVYERPIDGIPHADKSETLNPEAGNIFVLYYLMPAWFSKS